MKIPCSILLLRRETEVVAPKMQPRFGRYRCHVTCLRGDYSDCQQPIQIDLVPLEIKPAKATSGLTRWRRQIRALPALSIDVEEASSCRTEPDTDFPMGVGC